MANPYPYVWCDDECDLSQTLGCSASRPPEPSPLRRAQPPAPTPRKGDGGDSDVKCTRHTGRSIRAMGPGPHDAIIVGGGHNGLVCAAYLAKAGLDVLVLERREILGGACVTEELFPGFRFSACSYYCHLLQSKVIDDLELRRHGFHVYHIDPQKCSLFPGDRALVVWDDVERTQEAIGRFSTHDAAAYPNWVRFWERAAGLIYPYFLKPAPTLAELAAGLRTADDQAFLDALVGASMEDVVTEFFEDEAVRGAFIQAHDAGDPSAPGSAWVYAYIKCNTFTPPENIGIVKGGMGAITAAMAAAARSF